MRTVAKAALEAHLHRLKLIQEWLVQPEQLVVLTGALHLPNMAAAGLDGGPITLTAAWHFPHCSVSCILLCKFTVRFR